MAAKPNSIQSWVKHYLATHPPRSKSLIVTVFGDSLLPSLPGVWLSDLIALLQPFGVNSQLVRTSVFRLTSEDWLEARREGRRSLYSLTESGQQRVEHAYRRIYEHPPREWDGQWTIVILSKLDISADMRAELRRELEWGGFGSVTSGVFLHPRANRIHLDQVLRRFRLSKDVVVMQARELDGVATKPGARLAQECWDLRLVSEHYSGFLRSFQPVDRLLDHRLEPQTAFLVQTLLIHSFRRVVLHDPQLPAVLLPNDWPGDAAYDLCKNIYRKTFALTRAHLLANLEASTLGPLRARPEFPHRLGRPGEPVI